ncbi:MAG: dihydrolipoyllysine-residue acetyltransferase [Pseudomonadota bacterium]|nr:dihydrolipoyllysine-residue acetyltransferase [Pseudomonadota bacterium]
MKQEIHVPALGENIDEVEVVEVLVAEGDRIDGDDVLVTLESDKAAMDLPAEVAGTVSRVAVSAGDKVREGDLIAVLELADESQEGDDAAAQGGDAAAVAENDSAAGDDAAPQPHAEQEEGDRPDDSTQPDSAEQSAAETVVREVACPQLGENIESADIAELLVSPGDSVQAEEPLVTLETDKAAMDLPAPFAGTVKEIRFAVGDSVRPGDIIASIETRDANDSVAAPEAPRGGEENEAPVPDEQPKAANAQTDEQRDSNRAGKVSPPQEPAASGASAEASAGVSAHASPAIRKFARELGVELSRISGSGRKGRVTREDVQRVVKEIVTRKGASGSAAAPLPEIDFSQWGEVEEVPLSRIRQLTGENLGRSWPQIPQVTQFDEADITDLEAFRKASSAQVEKQGAKLTLVAILLKACARALDEFPDFNSSLHSGGKSLIRKHYIHIGVAVDTEAGLVVPVVRDVDRKGLTQLAVELADLSGRARERKLKPDELSGSSFTISSLGGLGGTGFTPIVNWPNVAILGVSRTQTKPYYDAESGQFVPRLMLPFSLSYDHRVIDGAAGVRFTRHLATLLEDLRGALL